MNVIQQIFLLPATCSSVLGPVYWWTTFGNSWEKKECKKILKNFKKWNLLFSGPSVVLSETKLNFSQVHLGETGTKTIELINQSDVEAVYQVGEEFVWQQMPRPGLVHQIVPNVFLFVCFFFDFHCCGYKKLPKNPQLRASLLENLSLTEECPRCTTHSMGHKRPWCLK